MLVETFTGAALPQNFDPAATQYPVFTAALSGKAVTAKDKQGLWAEDSTGAVRLLLRGNQTVTVAPGVTKTLASFRLLDALPGSFGSRRSYNSTGCVAVLATFTEKT